MISIKNMLLASALTVFVLVGVGSAASAEQSQPSTVIDKTIFKKGQNYTVDSTINGDLYCLGQDVVISGTINGDVMCAAQNIFFSGTANGSARFAAENVIIMGKITGNVSAIASNVKIEKQSILGADLQAAASHVLINGIINRDFSAAAKTVTINGQVGRDVDVKNSNLTVSNGATIGGSINNNSTKPANISNDAKTSSVNNYTTNKTKFAKAAKSFLLGYVYWFISFLIISFAIVWLFPKPLINSIKLANQKPLSVAAVGIITIFVAPLVLLILALTIVGIPLAILLALIYAIIIFMSGPFFAFLVGSKFLPEQRLWVRMLLGSSIVLVAYSLPVVGIFMALLVVVFGGGLFTSLIIERLPHAKQHKVATAD